MTRIARTRSGTALIGDDEGFVPLSSADPALRDATAALESAPGGLPAVGDASARRIPGDHLSFAIPLDRIRKLWGIGLNYAEHAADLDEKRPEEPASFMKPATAAVGPGGPIRLPDEERSSRVTAEAELGVVIGRTCRDVDPERVDEVVAGYVPVIDMTAEDILERNPRYLTRAKSFDSFIVLGPWIRTTEEIESINDVAVRTVVNGDVKAESTIDHMLFKPRELVSFHSKVMTLEVGDVISTGTPGASPIRTGDDVRAEVEEIGALEAPVV